MTQYDFSVNPNDRTPIWIQLRNRIIFLIESGKLKPDERMPTIRELATETQVNYNTISKVYQSLLGDGYIMSRCGKGTFVCHPKNYESVQGISAVGGVIDHMIDRCLELGVPLEEVMGQVGERIAVRQREAMEE